MISIDFSPYELKLISSEKILKGALIRIQDQNGFKGYADLHQWPLDSSSVQAQLSLRAAQQDMASRKSASSAWTGFENTIIVNNYLFTNLISSNRSQFLSEFNQACDQGFTTFKVKVGREPKIEIPFLRAAMETNRQVLWRLDFNSLMSPKMMDEFFYGWSPRELSQFEYIEDPFIYDSLLWSQLNKKVPLAFDQAGPEGVAPWDEKFKFSGNNLGFRQLILKPAIQDLSAARSWLKEQNLKITVTSFMDHPLGAAEALRQALMLKSEGFAIDVCGLRTQFLFQPTAFSQRLETYGPELKRPKGTGLGFDDLLKETLWLSS